MLRDRRRVHGAAPIVLALALLVGTAACTDDSADAPTTTVSPGAPGAPTLATFATLDELAAAVGDAGYPCELEYEGLEDGTGVVSLCTIGDGQATLRIWNDPADVTALAESGTATELTVYGANWTIDLRDPTTAQTLAQSLGATTG